MARISVLVVLLAAGLAYAADPPVTTIDTEFGPIKGVYEPEYKLVAFYAVPYAAPPVGDLRLRPPVPPVPWTKPRDCTHAEYLKICPQLSLLDKVFVGETRKGAVNLE